MPQIKWSKKDVIQAFSDALAGQTAQQGQPVLPNLAEKISQIASQNKGVKA